MTTPNIKDLSQASDRQRERVVGGGIQRRPLAARTPEAIMQMPSGLWRSLELASVLMGVDADLAPGVLRPGGMIL